MIFGTILNAITDFLNFMVEQLPAFTGLPSGLITAFDYFAAFVPAACGFVSGACTAFTQILSIVWYVVIGLVLFKITAWIFHWKQAK